MTSQLPRCSLGMREKEEEENEAPLRIPPFKELSGSGAFGPDK